MNLLTIVFMGRSGCGKGTQIKMLSELVSKLDSKNVFYLESGSQFRKFINEDFYASQLARQISDRGGLQPTFLSILVWGNELVSKMKEDEHLFIDGAPRREIEAKILEGVFDFYGRPQVDIVYLNVAKEWAIDKLSKRGRHDDKRLEDIVTRMNWFNDEVVPAIDFYRSHPSHRFHEINGEQTVEKVHEDIVKSLGL